MGLRVIFILIIGGGRSKGIAEVAGEVAAGGQGGVGAREGELEGAAVPVGEIEQDPVAADGERAVAAYVEGG